MEGTGRETMPILNNIAVCKTVVTATNKMLIDKTVVTATPRRLWAEWVFVDQTLKRKADIIDWLEEWKEHEERIKKS